LENSVEQNPTPDDGGASTLDPLDRIERMLMAESGSDDGQGENQDQSASDDDKPDGDGQQSDEPQLTTSDLAKLLKLEDGSLDLDEEGHPIFKTKVDGKEGTAKLQDLLKSYQLQEHVDRKAREAADREKAIQAREQEVTQQFQQRLQYAENLTQIAANQLLQEFQSINWNALEQQDAGQAALLRQKFMERQAQLRGVLGNIEQQKAATVQKWEAEQAEALQREAQRLPQVIPEWKDAQVAEKERQEIRDWAIKNGWEPMEVDSISRAHHVAVLRKAMLADRLQKSKPEIENKVRQAPKLVKPGQAVQNSQEQTLRNLRNTVVKSGGKRGVEELLMAKGLV
jgi:hypothetical protein